LTVTDRELPSAPEGLLGAVDRQRRFVLRAELAPVPCPACLVPVDAPAASRADVDGFDFGPRRRDYLRPYRLAGPGRVAPSLCVGPGWYWELNHDWLAGRLARARACDEEHPDRREGP
jgi:hypothetical protein